MVKKPNKMKLREWRRRQIIRRVTAVGAIILVAVFGIYKFNEYSTEKKAQEEAARIQAEKEQAEREAEFEKQQTIEDVLSTDKYKDELTALYEKYPQVETLLLNRDAYSDDLIEYFIGHEEAVDWVVDYPEYMEKSEEEINEAANQPIPDSEETRNGIPLLFQWDQRWGYASYGTGVIARDGCGPTVLSMAAIGFTGDQSLTPKVVADMAVEDGHYVEGSGSSWSLMDTGAKALGLSSSQITQWATWAITDELEKGNVVVCNVGLGDFTEIGHFILLVGLNEDGTVIVNDPNSRVNSEKNWEVQEILDQAKGLWTIGR